MFRENTFDINEDNLSKVRSLPSQIKGTQFEQSSQPDVIIGIALDALIAAESEQISLGQYQISWHQPQLTLSITDVDRGEIIKATFDANGNYQLHTAQITEIDVENFSTFDKQQRQQTQLEID